MTKNHFIVSKRDTAWQFSFRGDVTAPFTSREEAVAEAIDAAKQTGLGDISVIVQDADLRAETVWTPEGQA